jgi:hypothetical protein
MVPHHNHPGAGRPARRRALCLEIGIIVAIQISHTIPTAMSALPGSTMAVPMVLNCSIAKRLGVPHMAMRKMASGSLVGTIFVLPLALIVALHPVPFRAATSPSTPA